MDTPHYSNEFLAMLGHEMRNPLSALSHALQVWAQSVNDPMQMEELHNIMERQVRQLTRLSDDLLDVARITQGKFELHREPVELRQVIDDACEEVRPFIDRCSHSLTVTMSAEPMVVYGDASRLVQVFANLLQNAAKFTERNGSLGLTAELSGERAVVRIRDSGCGIEEHVLPMVFEGNMQVTGTRQDGLGIGLRLVKTIVELHGGVVTADSWGLGQGSEFTVQLPLTNEKTHEKPSVTKQAAQRQDRNLPQLPTYRILVVDDDRASADLLARILRSLNQVVTVANEGLVAIQKVLDERPQIVFLDIMMLGMDGCEVAHRLRGYPEFTELVLIALSGSGNEESVHQAMQSGFDKYLVKPASIVTLAEMLSEISVNRRQQAQTTPC